MMKALSLGGSLLWDQVESAGHRLRARPGPALPPPHVSMATPSGVVGALWRRMCACISGKLALM